MTELSAWKRLGALLVLCAVTGIASGQTFTTLVNFAGLDGAQPDFAALIQGPDGGLYGTTMVGGSNKLGTVFKITPGVLKTLYSFTNRDGSYPRSALALATDGKFYGTTYQGGTNNLGTVFKITPTGLVTTLHSFDNADGAYPYSALLQASDGNFYGTTALGGNIINCNGGCGTIFKIAPSGALLTLHKFDSTDGANPTGAMIEGADGNLYGTTENGGANNAGTVFKIDAQSALSTLHSFDGADGSNVFAGLVQGTDGNFYGTTIGGGVGFGTVFKITPAGVLTTLADLRYEAEPNAGLVQATDGNFYGATTFGGNTICNINGCGTLFEFTLNSGLSALHSFDGADGNYPTSSLLQATNGILYGTTTAGGSEGEGTVFSLDVGLGPFVAFVRSYGKVGQTGGILGQGFTGTTSVSLNGTPAQFTVVSDTFIRATVPPGATTGFVTVVTPSGTLTSNVPFRVLQ